MNKLFSVFLDRLAERFTAILAGVVSSRVESLRAEAQAEQQSQLEDLARKYEADGKIAIAKTLRERALQLTSTNLAGDGVDVIAAVSAEPLKLTGPNAFPGWSPGEPAGFFGTSKVSKEITPSRKRFSNVGPHSAGCTRSRIMSDALHLTPRDHAIVQALVQKVRLFSQRQIVDHWWNGELANSRRRLKRLADRNLIQRSRRWRDPLPHSSRLL
jgi:hypothetical protein